MRRNKPDKKSILALVSLLAVTAIGGTYAYFSQDLYAANEFQTGKYDTDITEEFIPPSDWQPGVTVDKKVQIKNSGNVDVAAVAKLTESCVRREDITITEYYTETDGTMGKREVPLNTPGSREGDRLSTVFTPKDSAGNDMKQEEVAIKNFGAGGSVVMFDSSLTTEKEYDSRYKDKWVCLRKEVSADDESEATVPVYYFLYAGLIEGGQTTAPLLESVTMNPKLESTVTNTKLVADVDENGKNRYTFTAASSEYGYDSVHYKLNVKAKTVQATTAAIDSVLVDSADGREMLPKEFAGLLDYVKGLCRE